MPDATRSETPTATDQHDDQDDAPETRERAAAWARGRTGGDGHAIRRLNAAAMPHAFAALAENVRDYAIFLLDPDGVIVFWGEGARLMKWWTKAEAEGGHLRMLYPVGGSDDGTAEEHIEESAATGEYTGEGQRVRSDGSTFWAGVTLTALRDESGTLLGFAKVTRDLTARRAADAAIIAASEAAERARAAAVAADSAKSGFLATMSHEIRTPINAILGYHQLLDLGIQGTLSGGQREYLGRASASGRHLLTLVDELLDFSRVESDRLRLARRLFRLGDVVAASLSLLAPQAAARGVELADEMSGLAAGTSAWGDEARVRQILVNLLTNAVKFTPEGGRVTVSAGAATEAVRGAAVTGDGPWAYVRVEDTGPGIAPAQQSSIFEPFVQADMTHTREHGGAGLGLAISRRLARLMGGDVTVTSTLGVGSTFVLWLPVAGEASAVEGTGPADGSRHLPDGAAGGLPAAGDALLAELELVLRGYARRLRADPATPRADALSEADVENHAASLVADVAATLSGFDVAAGVDDQLLRDGTRIQYAIAVRHGAQRARLGWSESELRRDFAILREEMSAAMRRRPPDAPSEEARTAAAEQGVAAAEALVSAAERASVAEWRRVRAESGADAGADAARDA